DVGYALLVRRVRRPDRVGLANNPSGVPRHLVARQQAVVEIQLAVDDGPGLGVARNLAALGEIDGREPAILRCIAFRVGGKLIAVRGADEIPLEIVVGERDLLVAGYRAVVGEVGHGVISGYAGFRLQDRLLAQHQGALPDLRPLCAGTPDLIG